MQEAGRYRSRFCNSGQRFALIILDVSYRVRQFLLCPKVFLAAAVGPWTLVGTPTTGVPHRSRRVCFERIQDRFRLAIGRDDCVNMICSHIQRPQRPFAKRTGFSNTRFDRRPLSRVKNHGSLFEQGFFVSFSCGVGRQLWSIVPSVKAIDRSPLVAMQPSAITAKCNQVSQRCMIVVEVDVIHVTAPRAVATGLVFSQEIRIYRKPVATARGAVTSSLANQKRRYHPATRAYIRQLAGGQTGKRRTDFAIEQQWIEID